MRVVIGCPARAVHLVRVSDAGVSAQCMECWYLTEPRALISAALRGLDAVHGRHPVTLPRPESAA